MCRLVLVNTLSTAVEQLMILHLLHEHILKSSHTHRDTPSNLSAIGVQSGQKKKISKSCRYICIDIVYNLAYVHTFNLRWVLRFTLTYYACQQHNTYVPSPGYRLYNNKSRASAQDITTNGRMTADSNPNPKPKPNPNPNPGHELKRDGLRYDRPAAHLYNMFPLFCPWLGQHKSCCKYETDDGNS